MLSGCCEGRSVGVVPKALLVVRLLVEIKKCRSPCAETTGLLEHSQWELLQIISVNCLFFYDSVCLIFTPET